MTGMSVDVLPYLESYQVEGLQPHRILTILPPPIPLTNIVSAGEQVNIASADGAPGSTAPIEDVNVASLGDNTNTGDQAQGSTAPNRQDSSSEEE